VSLCNWICRVWFAIRTSPRSGNFGASSELSLRGIENYLPTRRVQRNWSDRIKNNRRANSFRDTIFGPFFTWTTASGYCRRWGGSSKIVGTGKQPGPGSAISEIDNLRTLIFRQYTARAVGPTSIAWPTKYAIDSAARWPAVEGFRCPRRSRLASHRRIGWILLAGVPSPPRLTATPSAFSGIK